jgi:putative phosphoribosyl transferase
LPGAGILFEDRGDAGRRLAERLASYADERPVVFALPRGGVPVGAEVARSLGAPLEVIVSRKLGAPGQPEFDIGEDYLNMISARESAEAERRLRLFRGEGRPYPDLDGRTAILVDDGLATGVTARAALLALRRLAPRRLVLAVPVCAPQTANLLRPETDDLICLLDPPDLEAIGLWYRNFDQVPDGEVVRLLEEARRRTEPDASEENADPEKY